MEKVLADVQTLEDAVPALAADATEEALMERCSRIMDNARQIDDGKKEYHIITSYLNDIEVIENLPPDQGDEIRKAADFVARLNRARDEFLNTSRRISDAQFNNIRQFVLQPL